MARRAPQRHKNRHNHRDDRDEQNDQQHGGGDEIAPPDAANLAASFHAQNGQEAPDIEDAQLVKKERPLVGRHGEIEISGTQHLIQRGEVAALDNLAQQFGI